MMDLGFRESPLAADFTARHRTAIGHLQHLRRSDVQIAGERIGVKVGVRHRKRESGIGCQESE
jgi:hypothetical protein